MSTPIREFAIALLDDEQGINENSWYMLEEILRNDPCANDDIIDFVKATEGRFYLPEDAIEILKKSP